MKQAYCPCKEKVYIYLKKRVVCRYVHTCTFTCDNVLPIDGGTALTLVCKIPIKKNIQDHVDLKKLTLPAG